MKGINKITTLCFALTICTIGIRSQKPVSNIDSLKASLVKLPNDTSSVSKICGEARKFFGVDFAIFLDIVNIAEPKALISKSPSHICAVYYYKGMASLQLSDFEQASKYLTMSKIIAEKIKHYKFYISSVSELGNLYEINGNFNQALKYYQLALKVVNAIKDSHYKGMVLTKLSSVYYKKKEYEKSISLLRESVILFTLDGDTAHSVAGLNNLALMFCSMNQLDSAEYYINQSKKLIDQSSFNTPSVLMYYYDIRGYLDFKQKNYGNALKSLQLCAQYSKELSIPIGIYDSYHQMSNVYEKLENYKDALKYYKLYDEMVDSIITHENFVKAVEIENKYEAEKKENELLRINSENEIKQAEIQRMGEKKTELINYIILLIAVILMFIFLLIVLIIYTRSRRKAYKLLAEKNMQIESQSKELSKSAKLIAKFQFQMNPHFVFNALHNIQGLIIAKENSSATDQIQRLGTLMRKTFNNAEKDYITVEEEMLYLKNYFTFESNTANQNIQFYVQATKGLEEALVPPMMIQPFIENSLKHAQLGAVKDPFIKVNITAEDDFLCIIIEDNGKGIISQKTDNSISGEFSHSMSIIKSRIELMFQGIFFPIEKTAFSIKTVPEISSGTRIKFYLPLQYLY